MENHIEEGEAVALLQGVEASKIVPRLTKRSAAVGPIANGNKYKIWPLDTYKLFKDGLRDQVKYMFMCVLV